MDMRINQAGHHGQSAHVKHLVFQEFINAGLIFNRLDLLPVGEDNFILYEMRLETPI